MHRSKPCKYIVNKENCPFGQRCRFLHQYREDLSPSHKKGVEHEGRDSTENSNHRTTKKNVPVCRFYVNSFCKYGSKCRYKHVGKVQDQGQTTLQNDEGKNCPASPPRTSQHVCQTSSQPVGETSPLKVGLTSQQTCETSPQEMHTTSLREVHETTRQVRRQPVQSGKTRYADNEKPRVPPPLTLASFIKSRPHVQRPQKATKGQKEADANSFREIELEQLHARFPGDACRLLAKSPDKITFLLRYQPTDPDWHGEPTIMLEVTFPSTYPSDYCRVQLSNDQPLDPKAVVAGNKAIAEYWTPNKLGSLMFRPFLSWLDKNVVEFLQSCDTEGESVSFEGGVSCGEDGEEDDETVEESVPLVKSKKGTEIRLTGLNVGPTLGTAFWTSLKVVLSCGRCKNQQEVEANEEKLYSVVCGRCSNSMGVLYHLALVHTASSTIGYLELTRCTPLDVVFQSSSVTVTCLNCSSEIVSQGFFIGQPKDVYCRRCHNKITITAMGLRFLQHQQSDHISQEKAESVTVLSSKKQADILLKDGLPLPEYGICQHYKKSHRWLRFPCCGRAFPCDVCHDYTQDHPMERASRMICGYCSKEQGYSGKGICVRCGADLVSSRHSSHWEGGQGCRNKSTMCRLDKQKYKNSSKTICKKVERVGKKNQREIN